MSYTISSAGSLYSQLASYTPADMRQSHVHVLLTSGQTICGRLVAMYADGVALEPLGGDTQQTHLIPRESVLFISCLRSPSLRAEHAHTQDLAYAQGSTMDSVTHDSDAPTTP